jgi:serine phosphatase RsbU (regulator of sigma subunit)
MFGVEPDSARCDHVVGLAPGDLVILYTDGLIEKPGAPLAARLELLRDAVQRFPAETAEELVDELLAAFIDDTNDDIAIFAIGVATQP